MVTTKHTIVALVEDKPGVLNRMASLFRRRGFNIESIAVGHSELPHLSRMTIVVNGTTAMVEQVRKQLDKLIDVVKVMDITQQKVIARELVLIKVKATSSTRSEIIEIADIFRAKIVDVAADSLTIEITGDEDKIDSLLSAFTNSMSAPTKLGVAGESQKLGKTSFIDAPKDISLLNTS